MACFKISYETGFGQRQINIVHAMEHFFFQRRIDVEVMDLVAIGDRLRASIDRQC